MIESHRMGAFLLALASIVQFPAGERAEADALSYPPIVGYWTLRPDHDAGSRSALEPHRLMLTERPDDPLILEIGNLPPQLTIVPGDESITLVDGHGNSRRFDTSGEPERQRFNCGPVESVTTWHGGELRQEFSWASDLAIVRTFSARLDPDQLVVTTWIEGPLSDRLPIRRVYDSDAIR